MNPQPHPLLHFPLRMKSTSVNIFLQVAKNVDDEGKDLGCTEYVEAFPRQISEAYASPD